MRTPHSHQGPCPNALFLLAVFLAVAPAALAAADQTPRVRVFGPSGSGETPAARSQTLLPDRTAFDAGTDRTAFHLAVTMLPIPSLPTEDVDLVEVSVPAPGPFPAMAVWPTEGTIYFLDEAVSPPAVITTVATAGPNITGVDFVSNGKWGVFATLGFLHIFDMTPAAGPTLTAPPIPLPGTPARRDIDPILIPHAASPSGVAVVYATGTEVHCFAIPTGAPIWGPIALPTPVVEAVDPQINGAGTLLFVPTEGFMTAIDPGPGAVLSTTSLGTTLVREVDATFAVGDSRCYLPSTGLLWIFDGTPPAGGGLGLPLVAPLPIGSPLIEGNDLEIDPSGTFGFMPTLAFMYQVDLAPMVYAAAYAYPQGTVHQRNQDAVFTPPGVAPARAVYCVQGTAWIYNILPPGLPPLGVPTPGTLVDGVDPAFTDAPPFGEFFTVSTIGFTHVINAVTGVAAPFSPIATPGALRTDVDSKPGPLLGNKLLQPAIGGLVEISGFFANDWTVTTGTGVWVFSTVGAFAPEFVPTPPIYRGGDAQPLTLLGPPEPAFSVDHPDQDFLTKCWEYKFAMNRWPYWWYYSSPSYYPHWVPFGVFGPPALAGYDILNRYKVLVLDNNSLEILDQDGNPIQNIPMPFPIRSGLIWDWDNKTCKVRLDNDLEAIVNLTKSPASVSFVNYGTQMRWYPVVDRMNGWEFLVRRGGRRVWIYDHVNLLNYPDVGLESDVIRPPVFDEQRKTLCLPLANYKLAFINAHRLRLGLPNAIYYTPSLGAHIVGAPVFDVYNHHAIVKLYGGRVAVVDVDTGQLRWDSGILPYWPVGPLRVDCYNKVCKGFYRDAAFNYYEMHLNLYPLVFGAAPILQWLPVPSGFYGYPVFDSKDGYEFYRDPVDRIYYNSVFKPAAGGVIVTPFPMIGNLFVDRVNKYALVRLQGPMLFWMDLFKVTQGLPGGSQVINLTDALSNPVAAEDDIVFDTQGRYAVVHLVNGQVALIDMEAGAQTLVSGGLPTLQRQLHVHPFAHLANYPWFSGVGQGDVTIHLSPIYASPPGLPSANVVNTLAAPVEASDFVPPPPLPAPLQLPHEGGNNVGMVQFEFPPGTVEPGAIIQVTNDTKFDTDRMDEPNESVAESDGSAEVSLIAEAGDQVCFTAFDPAGNASPATCVVVTPVVGVPGSTLPEAFSFSLSSRNPTQDLARFRFALPERALVELAVFDIAGRKVADLVRAELPAGEHEALWTLQGANGRRAPAGIYLARFRAGGYEGMSRVVVMP